MIKITNQDLLAAYIGSEQIIRIYYLGELIWPINNEQKTQSCFSNGYWIDEYPWVDEDTWVD